MEKTTRYQPLAHNGSSDQCLDEEASTLLSDETTPRSRHSSCNRLWSTLGALLGFILYTGLVVIITLKASEENKLIGTRIIKSLANDYIRYEPQVWQQWENVDPEAPIYFTGEPSKEIDQNWHNLLDDMNSRIPASLMEELGRVEQGIKFPDDTYFGSLMVFHHLHCLKNVYHALHPEYYHLDRMTEKEKFDHQDHIEHCLHMLKGAIMCQADPMIVTMKWSSSGRSVPIGNLTSPHECVNWDRLMEWVQPNSIDVFEEGVLVHPEIGPVIVDGEFVQNMSSD